MTIDPNQVEIVNTEETFKNLMELANVYGKKILQYHKILLILSSMPRFEDGSISLSAGVAAVINEQVEDYEAFHAYAKKIIDCPTLH